MHLKVLQARYAHEEDPAVLRRVVGMLLKCMMNDREGGGYCVVSEHDPGRVLYQGARDTCAAFVAGAEAAPATDAAPFDPWILCVCVDTSERMIVLPEDRFGEELVGA